MSTQWRLRHHVGLQGMDLQWEPALLPALRLDGSISSPLSQNGIHLWGCQRDGMKQRRPKHGQQRLSRQQRPCYGFPQTYFTSAHLCESHPQDHSLWPVASSSLSMLLLCRRQGADLCKSPRQSLKEEAKLLLSQNNGCLSGLPLITVTLDVQTSALLWSLK